MHASMDSDFLGQYLELYPVSEPTIKCIHDYETEFEELFSRRPDCYEIIFFRLMYNFISTVVKTNERNSNFVVSEDKAFKYFPYMDLNIINAYNGFVEDMQSVYPEFCCNLIGGKVADLFDGKSFYESVGDYDIWLGPDVHFADVFRHVMRTGKYTLTKETGRYYEFSSKFLDKDIVFQVIKSSFDSFESILNGFDFLHCSVGYDGKSFFWKKGALKSIRKKEIFVNKIAPTKVLNERLIKYINRGYTLSFPTLSLLSISTILGVQATEIDEQLFYKYMAQHSDEFMDLRGSDGGYADVGQPFELI